MTGAKVKECLSKVLFMTAAVICIIAVVTIFVFIVAKSIPALSKIGVFDFIFGDVWNPNGDDVYDQAISGKYGILTMIVGSIYSTVGAVLVGGTLGFFTAVFLSRFSSKKVKKIFGTVINLLAGIPSVVYGFFGMYVMIPLFSGISPTADGSGLLVTSLVLGIMILPTVVALSKTSLDAVPQSYYEGARALGATHEQAVFRTVVPAAKSGITASIILGVGRAIGETMAVIMIAGNSPEYPGGLFGSFRTLTANIVLEMGYAGEVQMGALLSTGVVLLVFIAIINLLFGLVMSEKRKQKNKVRTSKIEIKQDFSKAGKYISWATAVFVAIVLVLILGFIFIKGIPHIKWDFLFSNYSYGGEPSIGPAIVATLMLIVISIVISVPLGIATAVYLNEYTQKGSRLVRLVRSAIDVLSGIPSIVYGLFGSLTFVVWFGNATSILAGGFTISIMLLPVVVRSTEESLKTVPDSFREGSLALGAGKVRTIFKVVLPSALPGIFSAVILAVGRVVSETAPLVWTMGSVIQPMPEGFLSGGASLAVALYALASEYKYMNQAYATACVLMAIVLILNTVADIISSRLQKKLQGENNVSKKK
ncbi:MAG TPA: phosphate ABC transporter permease subunit PstC [Candidatus Limihabitans stercoravium]|nr:phosphate ABC transporter permease subunit PstC [Candidatus Limihabitans stercoravium]